MVLHAKQKAAAEGYQSITLGTETSLGAFHLYRKYGFTIIDD
jgi:ribosomal protein S18 acetylase RimI-like enzyme